MNGSRLRNQQHMDISQLEGSTMGVEIDQGDTPKLGGFEEAFPLVRQ